jgi:hypothetical protein
MVKKLFPCKDQHSAANIVYNNVGLNSEKVMKKFLKGFETKYRKKPSCLELVHRMVCGLSLRAPQHGA